MRIAIIGGIGSGKSEAMKVAKEKGFYCISADEINSRLLRTPEYVAKIAERFPEAVKGGVVDKKVLASIVFADEDKRKQLNSVAHPEIMRAVREDTRTPLAAELPLYIEGGERDFDEVVLVNTPILQRIARLKKRGLAPKDAITRIKAQPSNKALAKYCTRVLYNGGSLEKFRKSAAKLFDDILENKQNEK